MAFPVHSWTPITDDEKVAYAAHSQWLLDGNSVHVGPHNGRSRVLLWRIFPASEPEMELWVRADQIDARTHRKDASRT